MKTNISSISRRSFMKQCVVGGITVYSAPLLFAKNDMETALADETLQNSWKSYGVPNFRFDAIAKVTGEKIFGSDYRAKDIPSWPNEQTYGYIVRVDRADRIYKGLDLSILDATSSPTKVITAKDLKRDKLDIYPSWFYGKDILLSEGQTPLYLGHEVAILLFDTFLSFKLAKQKLQFNENFIQYGAKVPLASSTQDPYGIWRFIREEGEKGKEDKYSLMKDGFIWASKANHKPVWPESDTDQYGNSMQKGMYYAKKLKEDFEKKDNWFTLDHTYKTQSIDHVSLETESYNGWLDSANKTLHMVITTQSGCYVYERAAKMIENSTLAEKVENIVVHASYIGGGFGGKDHTIYPYLGVVASMYSNKPVRMANDRYEQFQSGLKRHPFTLHNKLSFDKKTKKIQGFISNMDLDGGGRPNYSSIVALVGATASQGIYYIPRNDIVATAYPSHLPTGGSMRGFGCLQTMSAIEMMMNEASEALGVDPIELRRINAAKPEEKNSQGAMRIGFGRHHEMLDMIENHEIWKNRKSKKIAFEKEHPGKRYGVGLGFITTNYGVGGNCPSTRIEIDSEGKISMHIISMEMGTGTDTSQAALISEYLGSMADDIKLAGTEYLDLMKLEVTQSPYLMSQEHQDEMSLNPRWTPDIYMSSSASSSSYYQTHTTRIAAKLLLEHGLYPAAIAIWKRLYTNEAFGGESEFPSFEKANWRDGKLSVAGYPPLALSMLAKKADDMGLVTGVCVHAFNRWAWASADFTVQGKKEKLFADALAVRYGKGASEEKKSLINTQEEYHLLDRENMLYPSTTMGRAGATYYTPCATLVELAVNEGSGEVDLLQAHTWLYAGRILVKELVEGQIEGGLAMGVGHALYEYLPLDETGAGSGNWNLNRYHVPRSKEVVPWNMSHTILKPLSDTDPAKGMGEVVMIPVVPAIVEAIYQATSKRFYHLPITREDIAKEV
ncbi:MAG: xanthine dehydrogenase family protein molybdopterin-binding subunit [Sulfurovum sp.]|nr:MAG: xanthine dehydrogenase family protein molybdopterin-binding subunit [Sulfurovum sp.]